MAGGVAVAVAVLVAACGGDDGSGDDAGSRPQEAPAGGTAHSTTGAWGSAEPDPAFPPQPDGVPFPGETWPEGDWPDGVDRAAVDAAVDAGFAGGAPQRVRAVLIVHGGEIVYERYSPHAADGPRAVMPGYSMAKSFTSALVGVLARERRIDVEAPAAVPEWRADDDPRHAITDGVWDGRRVLPDGWVEYSRRPSATNPEYGAGWWLDRERPGVFYAVGILGQVIGVAPDLDLVFVQLATDSDLSLAVSEAILDAFAAV